MKLTEIGERIHSLVRRVEGLEHGQQALNRLATAVEILATKQDTMGESVEKLSAKMDAMESRPTRRWENILDRLVVAAMSAVAGWLLARLGASL